MNASLSVDPTKNSIEIKVAPPLQNQYIFTHIFIYRNNYSSKREFSAGFKPIQTHINFVWPWLCTRHCERHKF